MGESNGDLCLLLVGNDSWLEWVVILRKVTQWAPCQWRTAADWQKELKGHISFLWKLCVSSHNASPGSLADSVRLSEAVTRGARELNLTIAMAPKYQWSDNV